MEINLKSNMKIHNNFKARLYDKDGILIDEGIGECGDERYLGEC